MAVAITIATANSDAKLAIAGVSMVWFTDVKVTNLLKILGTLLIWGPISALLNVVRLLFVLRGAC